jgi:hypothetical protein
MGKLLRTTARTQLDDLATLSYLTEHGTGTVQYSTHARIGAM